MEKRRENRDVTQDLLLCNRCGKCRAVCPLYDVLREEWGGSRGKVELAEAFFRGDDGAVRDLFEVFDLCLQCMACEENCPSGMRAEEVVMAVRAEMAHRGMIPWYKKLALRLLDKTDPVVFRIMRTLGIRRQAGLHGQHGRNPLSPLFPLLGWKKTREVPLPAKKPFLSRGVERFPALGLDHTVPSLETCLRVQDSSEEDPACPPGAGNLARLIIDARRSNLENRTTAYFFVGHTVNHFFPEEAEAVVWLLNLLGIDVIAPADQLCCGAPLFYSGDVEKARSAAVKVLEGFSAHEFDWIVTSCASGGRMLRTEFPRLLDTGEDGFFELKWDGEDEVFTRGAPAFHPDERSRRAAEHYRDLIEGKVLDVNEAVAMVLGLEKESGGDAPGGQAPGESEEPGGKSQDPMRGKPVVTYHHPCHLDRGQGVGWQPEAILRLLPDWKYVPMRDADRCCGGGGTFTFSHSGISEKVADVKADRIAEVGPDAVATACPLCRIQLRDTLRRRFVLEAEAAGEKARDIPVLTPVEMLVSSIEKVLEAAH